MELLKLILKDKLFYILLVAVLVISSAMKMNKENIADLLDEYYHSYDTLNPEGYEAQQHGVAQIKTLRDSLVEFALTLKGRPYKYAGKGPNVFDCSGFTGYVYRHFNLTLPASSALQSTYGEEEATEAVKRGDLLIFKSPTPGVNRVGHVGMVISNENGRIDFIHSSSGRGVVIDSLSHRHYKARYMGARKILKD